MFRAEALLGDQHDAAGDLSLSYSASSGHTVHRIVRAYDTHVSTHADREAHPMAEGTTPYSCWAGEQCWLCGEWRPVRCGNSVCGCVWRNSDAHACGFRQMWFEYRAPVSGPMAQRVMLMLEFDNWQGDPMDCNDGVFRLARMVPKRTFQFLFDVDGVKRAAMDELYARTVPFAANAVGNTFDGVSRAIGTDDELR